MTYETFNEAVVDLALIQRENQMAMRERHPAHGRYFADILKGTLTLDRSRYRIVSLGNVSSLSGTFLWYWANPQSPGDGHKAVAPLVALRDRADELRLPELAEPLVPVDEIHDLDWLPGAGLATVAAHHLGAHAVYSYPYPNGRAWLALMDAPEVQPNLARFPSNARDAIAVTADAPTGVRHRQIFRTYADVRGLRTQETDTTLELQWPQGSTATIAFDEDGRAGDIETHVSPAEGSSAEGERRPVGFWSRIFGGGREAS